MAAFCSECGDSLAGKHSQAVTCSGRCRGARSRRLAREKKRAEEKGALTDDERQVRELVTGERDSVVRDVVREEIRPAVREAITQDVMKSLNELVGLTPRAVEAIKEDLFADDLNRRQRAYTLLMKYTVGHSALVSSEEEDKSMIVNFNLPRPEVVDSTDEVVEAAVVLEESEIKACDLCGETKSIQEFVASSDRCKDCYAKQRADVQKMLNG